MHQAKSSSVKERLLTAASVLFYNDGIGATGVDNIIKKAGIAKMSFYNNFESKAELVSVFLKRRHAEWLSLYDHRVKLASTPKKRVLSIFDAYADHANCDYKRGFRGCGLLNAAAELPAGNPGRDAVRQYKEEVEALLAKRLAELVADRPKTVKQLAAHLAFILEGSMSRAGLEGNDCRVQQARHIAAALLEAC